MNSHEHRTRTETDTVQFLGPGFELEARVQERVFGGDVLRITDPETEGAWILTDAPVEVEP